ncbi:hypothetical protein [Synechocystis sp. PCC 6714]|uniref:hypothetical protein n=1 Tax=Synechocystis sp. (strain PCC 6714) TaxID=1147 RepID=UPI0003F96DC8|nr:hypothetical protein [Synechocystis sp. PCC 6714]AIE76087.1 hypothetical protein D082_40410 [Synechocystis sp. PCC 6714]AIE76218.1 hypothetical protein D082_50560 [Synechocystis sp. PCC 6714]
MAQITLDLPDELLEQIVQAGENPSEWLRHRLPDILKPVPPLPAHLYRHILNFIASNPTPQQISDFRPTPEMQERLRNLLNREENLTPSEQAELEEYERIEHLVVMLKAGNLKNLVG